MIAEDAIAARIAKPQNLLRNRYAEAAKSKSETAIADDTVRFAPIKRINPVITQ